MAERGWVERVDDAILNQCYHLSNLRGQSYHASVTDFRQSSIENRVLCADVPAAREDFDIWSLRVDRCNELLTYDDLTMRRRMKEARGHQ